MGEGREFQGEGKAEGALNSMCWRHSCFLRGSLRMFEEGVPALGSEGMSVTVRGDWGRVGWRERLSLRCPPEEKARRPQEAQGWNCGGAGCHHRGDSQ